MLKIINDLNNIKSELYFIKDLEVNKNIINKDSSGIYFIYNEYHKLLYIGKSINLKNRIKSHFNNSSHLKDVKNKFELVEIFYYNELIEYFNIEYENVKQERLKLNDIQSIGYNNINEFLKIIERYFIINLHPEYNGGIDKKCEWVIH